MSPHHASNQLCGLFVAAFPSLTGFASSLRGVGFVPPMPAEAAFCTPGRATRMDSDRWDRVRKLRERYERHGLAPVVLMV